MMLMKRIGAMILSSVMLFNAMSFNSLATEPLNPDEIVENADDLDKAGVDDVQPGNNPDITNPDANQPDGNQSVVDPDKPNPDENPTGVPTGTPTDVPTEEDPDENPSEETPTGEDIEKSDDVIIEPDNQVKTLGLRGLANAPVCNPEDYEYMVNDDGETIILTNYHGEDSEVEIPSEIDGYRVIALVETFAENADVTKVIIPEGIEAIAYNTFYFCTSLAEVSIPESCTYIGESAFYNTAIEEVNLPDSVTIIDTGAFGSCSGITEIDLPQGLEEIGDYAFSECENLVRVYASENINTLGTNVFENTDNLTIVCPKNSVIYKYAVANGITVEESGEVDDPGEYQYEINSDGETITLTKYIGSDREVEIPSEIDDHRVTALRETFDHNTRITKVSIPDGVEEIGYRTFYYCTNLSEVNIPDGCTNIGDSAFCNTAIEEVIMPASVKTIGWGSFDNCSSLNNVVLSENLEVIPGNAFSWDSSLETIVIPDKVKRIEANAFSGCSGIVEITLPKGLEEIGGYAFSGCENLERVNASENIRTVGTDAFENTEKLTIICPKNSVIYKYAVANGINVEVLGEIDDPGDYQYELNADGETITLTKYIGSDREVEIPSEIDEHRVTALQETFYYNARITKVVIPESVEEIGYNTFYYCTNLAEVNIPDGCTYIGDSAFYNTAIEEVNIPDSVVTLEDDAFSNCVSLSKVVLSKNLETIPARAFSWDTSLEKIVIPRKVKKIGLGAFGGCSSIVEITLPEGLEEIGGYAFSSCENLERVYAGGNIKTIGAFAFDSTEKLTITCPKDSVIYNYALSHGINVAEIGEEAEQRNYQYELNSDGQTITLTDYLGLGEEIEIPSEIDGHRVTALEGTFKYNANITNVAIPESVQEIGKDTFYNCTNLRKVVATDKITTIDEAVFDGDDILTIYCPKDSEIYRYAKSHGIRVNVSESVTPQEDDPGQPLPPSADHHKVTFRLQGGDFSDTDSVVFSVNNGETIAQPEDPTRVKYTFAGWYTAAVGGTEFDFTAPITEDTYIYAQWTARYKAATPQISVTRAIGDETQGTTISEDTELKLSSASYDAKIYYTVNPETPESAPTSSDNLYTDRLIAKNLAADDNMITIKAIAIKDGYDPSDVATFTYQLIPETEKWGKLTDADKELYTTPAEIPTGLWTAGITDKIYTGAGITFAADELRVYDGKRLLTFNTDYTVAYRNNVNVGTATITVTGKNNYTGSITRTFAILPRDIADDTCFTSPNILLQFNNRVQKAGTSLIFDNGTKKITLRVNSDYTVTYPCTDPKAEDYDATAFKGDAATDNEYTITLTGKGNYTGTRTITERIISSQKTFVSKLTVSVPAVNYSDADENGYVTPTITVKNGRTDLVGTTDEKFPTLDEEQKAAIDYTYTVTNNDKAGTGTVRITGRNNYEGVRDVNFTIKGIALSSAKFTDFTAAYTYNGHEQKQPLTKLTYNGADLTENVDYEVTYAPTEPINVGTVTVTYTGLKGFTGTVKKTYRINAYNMATDAKLESPLITATVTDTDGDNVFAYVKGGVTPIPTVTFDGTPLEYNTDFTLRYTNNNAINASRIPTITITGKGNFTGSINATFTIEPQTIDAQGLTLKAADKVYANKKGNYTTTFTITDSNGKALASNSDFDKNVVYTYAENVTLFDGTNREEGDIAESTDIVPAGTIMNITATGKGLYTGTITGTYRMVTGDISKASVRVYTQYYTGSEVRPDKNQIEVKIGNTILSPEDYEIDSYTNNINKGTAKVTLIGVGDYGGEKTVNFTIATRTMNYMVIFNGNGSTGGSVGNMTIAAGKTVALNQNRFTRKDYTFAGWNTEPDGSGTAYADREQITNDGIESGVNLILFAQWVPTEYNIIYHLNGGLNNAANTKLTYTAADSTFAILPPEREDWALGYQFGGWYKETDYKNRITEVKSGSSGDIHLYAKWIPYTYTVHFDGNGATAGTMTDATFSYGVPKALSPNKFTRKGHVFVGWTREPFEVNEIDASDTPYKDKDIVTDLIRRRNNVDGELTLYAVWRDSFSINYDLMGGAFTEGTKVPVYYTYGTATNLPNPVRDGYTFGGWYRDVDFKQRVTSISKTMSGDYDLIAKWTPYSYTVSFNGNGSTGGSVRAQKMAYGTPAALTANSFTRKGYVFAGWSSVKDPTPANPGMGILADGAELNYLPPKNNVTLTLYAQWEETDYTITYHTNGGTLSPEAENYIDRYEYNHNGGYPLPVPEKDGFTFMGWYSDPAFKTKVNSIAKTSWGDLDLYAKWDMPYIVIFDQNVKDGDTVTGTMANQAMKYQTAAGLRGNAYKSKIYVFMGWATSPADAETGTVAFTNGQKISQPDEALLTYDSELGSRCLKLYAVWRNSFAVEYELNGGTFEGLFYYRTAYDYNATMSYNLPTPTRDGYTFAGWYSDVAHRTRVTNIPRGSSGDKMYYAKWTGKNYKITFKADPPADKKSTGGMGVQTLPYGTSRALNKNAFKITGFTFVGWSTVPLAERTESDPILLNGQNVEGIYDIYHDAITLYAVWERDVYSIIYNNVAGIDNSMNPDTYNVDDRVVLGEPQMLGDTFLGWYSDKGFRTKVTEIKTGTVGNKTFYARWAKTQYTINYNLNAGNDPTAVLDTRSVGYINSYEDRADSGYRLATASRTGYVFSGWFKEAACRTAVGPIISSPNVDMTVYAKWTPHAYTISFLKNNAVATGTMRDMTNLKVGTKYTLTANAFSSPGHVFEGWVMVTDPEDIEGSIVTDESGNPKTFTNRQQIMDLTYTSGDTIYLAAMWTTKDYVIKYFETNGTVIEGITPTGYTYEEVYDEGISPVGTLEKEGYDFAGWYRDNRLTRFAGNPAIPKRSTGDINLYAKWTPHAYTIKFIKNNAVATGTMKDMTNLKVGTKYTLTANAFSSPGHVFEGWVMVTDPDDIEGSIVTDESGTPITFTNKQQIMDLTYTNGDTIYLAGKWTTKDYEIKYLETNGTVIEGITPTGYTYEDVYDEGINPIGTPEKEGFDFAGWYKDTRLSSIAGNPVIPKRSTGNINLYAKWTPHTYTIKFVPNNTLATGTMKDMTGLKVGNWYNITANAFKSPGHDFVRWVLVADPEDIENSKVTDEEGNPVTFADKSRCINLAMENEATVYLVAEWKSKEYTIKYIDTTGLEIQGMTPTTYTYEDVDEEDEGIVPEYDNPDPEATNKNPVKDGYTFVGWYFDNKYTKPAGNPIKPPDKVGNLVLYAKWYNEIPELPEDISGTLNVLDYGAVPNDGNEDNGAINDALEVAHRHASADNRITVYVPPGEYDITDLNTHSVKIYSYCNLMLDPEAVFHVTRKNNDSEVHGMIGVNEEHDIVISGGKLIGGRSFYSGDEYGMGLNILGSYNITIANMEICDNWGDGIYLGFTNRSGCHDVNIINCNVHYNRRNNVTITYCDNVLIDGCTITNARGTEPQAGICIEPNEEFGTYHVCDNIYIRNTTITTPEKNNWRYRSYHAYNGGNRQITSNVVFDNCTVSGWFSNWYQPKPSFINGTVIDGYYDPGP